MDARRTEVTEITEEFMENLKDKALLRRSMMIWRQMVNIFGQQWVDQRGVRVKLDGKLTFVARQWSSLPAYSDVEIRQALAILADYDIDNMPSFFDFEAILKSRRDKERL